VHCRSYPWATDDGAVSAFARAHQLISASL
jgi:hypothetical protein